MLKKSNQKGFTIIEVLIVLAIAGLILLVVFLAVPALQRNSRNSGYRNEANRLLGAVQEISANNGGNTLTASGSGTAGSDAAKVFAATNAKNLSTIAIEAYAAGGNTAPTLSTATVVTGAKCPSASPAVAAGKVTLTAGTTRQTALLYAVEDNAGAAVVQCTES